MKKFLIYTVTFVCINMLLIYAQDTYTYYTGAYRDHVAGAEIYQAKQAAKQKKKVKKLLIGDSVCRQMYGVGQVGDSIWSLACNQAVTMAGHYCLVHDFITTNKDSLPQEIILSFDCKSFANNLDKYTFQYFLKPFPDKEYQPLLTNRHLLEREKQIPYRWAAHMPIIRCNSWAPEYELTQEEYTLLSPLSSDYLDSICTLAEKAGIQVHMYCNPMRESRQQTFVDIYQKALNTAETQKHQTLWEEWYQSVTYLPDSLFHDFVHFYKQDIPDDPYLLK